MIALGYSLTWPTECFIDGGCGARVFAHTNGEGDFVLFDDLGHPWPIHDCYSTRYAVEDEEKARFVSTKAAEFGARVPEKQWEFVVRVDPEKTRQKNFRVVGSVTAIDHGITGRLPAFREARAGTRKVLDQVLEGRNTLLTIVTGEGEEFEAFWNSKDAEIEFGDVVGANLKVRQLLGTSIFVVALLKVFKWMPE